VQGRTSQRSIKSRRTLQRGNTIPKTNRDRQGL
jgi:hypothetical protein